MQQITDLGMNSGIIISAYKSDQPQEANHYVKGFLDKALQAHLSGNFNRAEQYYQQLFALIDKLANTKTGASWQNAKKNYHPFLVNLYAKWGQPNKSQELIKGSIEAEEKNSFKTSNTLPRMKNASSLKTIQKSWNATIRCSCC